MVYHLTASVDLYSDRLFIWSDWSSLDVYVPIVGAFEIKHVLALVPRPVGGTLVFCCRSTLICVTEDNGLLDHQLMNSLTERDPECHLQLLILLNLHVVGNDGHLTALTEQQ